MKVRSEERLAATSELNPAPNREARGKGYRATTRVKGLSPEMVIVPDAEAVTRAAGSILIIAMRDGANLAGSETVARYQIVNTGTWETPAVLEGV